LNVSPSTSIDYDSPQEFVALLNRPQSTPISSPILFSKLSSNNPDNQKQTNENYTTMIKNNKKQRITTYNYSSLTNVTPNNQIKSPILFEIIDDDNNENQYLLRPPPLMVLSQNIQAKHPEKLNDTKLNNQFSSIKDLPNAPANYSFVFYNFSQMFVFQLNKYYQ